MPQLLCTSTHRCPSRDPLQDFVAFGNTWRSGNYILHCQLYVASKSWCYESTMEGISGVHRISILSVWLQTWERRGQCHTRFSELKTMKYILACFCSCCYSSERFTHTNKNAFLLQITVVGCEVPNVSHMHSFFLPLYNVLGDTIGVHINTLSSEIWGSLVILSVVRTWNKKFYCWNKV